MTYKEILDLNVTLFKRTILQKLYLQNFLIIRITSEWPKIKSFICINQIHQFLSFPKIKNKKLNGSTWYVSIALFFNQHTLTHIRVIWYLLLLLTRCDSYLVNLIMYFKTGLDTTFIKRKKNYRKYRSACNPNCFFFLFLFEFQFH